MGRRKAFFLVGLLVALAACGKPGPAPVVHRQPLLRVEPLPVVMQVPGVQQLAIGDWRRGGVAAPSPGTLLMGGGREVPSAMRWFAERAGGGRLLILRASGGSDLQEYFYEEIGGVSAARTLVFTARSAAFDPEVAALIDRADAVFIAGGDQARYIRFWKDTPVQQLLTAHVQSGKPIGGTSAGLAILGGWAYGALDDGSIDSLSALADPLGQAVTLEQDFLQVPWLRDVLTDTHFGQRDRQGRLLAFVNKARNLSGQPVVGLGVDEDAALALEADGRARLHRLDPAHVAWLIAPQLPAEQLQPGQHLRQGEVAVIGINGESELDLGTLDVHAPAFLYRARTDQGQWQLDRLQ